jgi:hypothetical protein
MVDSVLQGGCLCGAVRYEINGAPMLAGHCHCLDCRKASGAAHGSFAAYPREAVNVTGQLTHYKTKADSGTMASRGFCPVCGTWVTGSPGAMPHVIALTLATFDDPEAVSPAIRFYDKRRISWDTVDPALPAFPAMPPAP